MGPRFPLPPVSWWPWWGTTGPESPRWDALCARRSLLTEGAWSSTVTTPPSVSWSVCVCALWWGGCARIPSTRSSHPSFSTRSPLARATWVLMMLRSRGAFLRPLTWLACCRSPIALPPSYPVGSSSVLPWRAPLPCILHIWCWTSPPRSSIRAPARGFATCFRASPMNRIWVSR